MCSIVLKVLNALKPAQWGRSLLFSHLVSLILSLSYTHSLILSLSHTLIHSYRLQTDTDCWNQETPWHNTLFPPFPTPTMYVPPELLENDQV